jgi:NAD(P)-dependent dehydrogenase (short-subunit alcohol dehydrogenase family)
MSDFPYQLTDQIAIVTGAAQGLGLGIAEQLASNGALVYMADLQEDKVNRAADSLRPQGLKIEPAILDVTDSTAVTLLFEQIADRHGHLDILVNNAGIGQKVLPITDLDDDEWDRVLRVTLTGTFYGCRAAGGIMERQEAGSIVNISSINGQNPAALVAAYNAAKEGVISLTRTMALEMAAYGVRVNAVCPGPVYTAFNISNMAQRSKTLDLTEEEMVERIRGAIPLGRWGEAVDIARGVAFLCSPAASWITGEVLRISGGMEGVAAAPPKRERG